MTKKDYIALAQAIARAKQDNHSMNVNVFIDNLSNVLYADNPRFDRAKFLIFVQKLWYDNIK